MTLRPSILLACGALALAACTDPTTSPTTLKAPKTLSLSRSKGTPTVPTDQHVFVMNGDAIPDNFAEDVTAAGGTLVREQPEIGVAVVRGLSDAAAHKLARFKGQVERDVMVQWLPPLDESQVFIAADAAVPVEGQSLFPPQGAAFLALQWNMRQVHAPEAWTTHTGIPGVRVAILDTGLDPDHIDQMGLIDVASSVAFTPSLTGPPAWADDHLHGTHVGGIVTSNNIGTAGVAPNVTLIAIKVLNSTGNGSFADVIAGLIHAANVRANVANLSLGALFRRGEFPQLMAALNRAVNYANRHGVLVVSAAGNDYTDLQHAQDSISAPCESGTGVCISSTGPTDQRSSFSNYGVPAINVAAPGGEFGPSATHFVLGLCSSRSVIPAFAACKSRNRYLFVIGTSQAAPHVSGLAALLDSKYLGTLTPAQLQARMEQCSDDLGKAGADPDFGKGRINALRTMSDADCNNSSP